MKKAPTFGEVLEEAEQLSVADKAELVEILNKRMIERSRQEIARDIKGARAEYRKGACKGMTPQEVIKEILS